jgi:hypothetical protein
MRFGISGEDSWLGLEGDMAGLPRAGAVVRTTSGTLDGKTVFATNSRTCYHTQGPWLMDAKSKKRLGQILENRSWIWAGENFGFGLYRVGLVLFYFIFRDGASAIKSVDLSKFVGSANTDGKIVDMDAKFDAHHVLFTISCEKGGHITNSMFLIHETGQVKAHISGSPTDNRMLAAVHGRLILGGRALTATDEGVLSLKIAGDTFEEGTLFPDTAEVVSASTELLAGADGFSIYAVNPKEITQLVIQP